MLNDCFGKSLLMLVCASAICVTAQAQELAPAQAEAITTVQELLRLDSATAISIEQQRLLTATAKPQVTGMPIKASVPVQPVMTPATPNPPAASSTPAAPVKAESPVEDQVELLSIFGFGEQIRADVAINGTRLRFQKGQTSPINGPSVEGFRLISLKTPCAVLANAQGSRTLCIKRG